MRGATARASQAAAHPQNKRYSDSQVNSMAMYYQAINDFAAKVENSPDLEQRLKENPVQALKESAARLQPTPLSTDTVIYRWVVIFLGMTVLVSILGAIVLTWRDTAAAKEPPQILTAIGSAAVGALAGLLAPSPAQR